MGGGGPSHVRGYVDVKHITSDELGDVVRLGIIVQFEFTYVLYQSWYIQYAMLRTLNGVHDSWAKEMSVDGLAGVNCADPRH